MKKYPDSFFMFSENRLEAPEEIEMVDYGTRTFSMISKNSKARSLTKFNEKFVPAPLWLRPFEKCFDVVSTLTLKGGFLCLEDFKNSSQGGEISNRVIFYLIDINLFP